MRIGVRAHDFGKHTPEVMAKLLHEGGYNAAQLVLPKAIEGIDGYADIPAPKLDEIREAFGKYDIQISVLGCYMDLSCPDEEERTAALRNVFRCLRYAKRLGAAVVGSETSWAHLSREEKRMRTPAMLDSIRRIVAEAERVGQDFAVEPVQWHPLADTAAMRRVLEAADHSPRLKIIFDAANVITPDTLACQSEVWEEWLDAFQDRIVALHIKDFCYGADGRYIPKPLGEGEMDYRAICRWLRGRDAEIALLREETIHGFASSDRHFMIRLWEGGE